MKIQLNTTQKKERILIAPLNWGLGHATRCIPIIQQLLLQGHFIIIATENEGKALLEKEFPNLPIITLKGYDISYSKTNSQVWKIISQIPKILYRIKKEHSSLKKIIAQHQITTVISDNRFGMWSSKVRCIYITHQLRIMMPKWLKPMEFVAEWIHRTIINRYDECWIPDFAGENNLSGELSHRNKMPQNAKFIGILSRFENINIKPETTKKFHTVAIVSGVEPQRTLFLKKITSSLLLSNEKSLIIGGTPSKTETFTNKNITFVNHLSSEEFANILYHAKRIICRSGYSTMMDLETLKKSAEIIATPGQTEQEYLAKYLIKKGKHQLWKE